MLKHAGLTSSDAAFTEALSQATYGAHQFVINRHCKKNCALGFKECTSCYCFADAMAYTFVRHGVGVTVGDVIEELKRGQKEIWSHISESYAFFDMTVEEAKKLFLQDVDESVFGKLNRLLILPDFLNKNLF